MATGLTAYVGYAAFDPGPDSADLAIAQDYRDPDLNTTAQALATRFRLTVAALAPEDVTPEWRSFYAEPSDGEIVPNFRFTGDPKRIANLTTYLFSG